MPNTLIITINKPVAEVFEAALNPANTPKWIDSMAEEQTSQWPVQLGTEYRNRGATGDWTKYQVTAFKPNQLFELSESSGGYRVKYTFTPKGPHATELQYSEWVGGGQLEHPLSIDALRKLKAVIEAA
jgi:uncharacterized protein YndB with AHSA1/START domain